MRLQPVAISARQEIIGLYAHYASLVFTSPFSSCACVCIGYSVCQPYGMESYTASTTTTARVSPREEYLGAQINYTK
jgi:spore maturation protein SpmB